jgi:hypothetical protein
MYWSELAAERVKRRRLGRQFEHLYSGRQPTHQALMMWGRTLMPADSIATTKGEAEAPPPVPFLAA